MMYASFCHRLIVVMTTCCAATTVAACGESNSGRGESGDAVTSMTGSDGTDDTASGSSAGSSSANSGSSASGDGTGSTTSGTSGTTGATTNGSGTTSPSSTTNGSATATSGAGTNDASGGDDVNPGAGGSSGAGGAGGSQTAGAGGAPGAGGAGGSELGGAGGEGGGQGGSGGALGSGGMGGNPGGPDDMGGSGGMGGSDGEGSEANDCPEPITLPAGMEYCTNTRGNAGGGYGYELWAEGGGSGCMTVHGIDATFSASWTDVEDFLARVGLDFDQTRTHSEIGNITAEFQETKSDDGGLTYIGIYGWTVNPLREFYILDDWGMEKPGGFSSDGTPRDEVGTLVADGETYDVWKKTRVDKPSIEGEATFDQYFSIRRTARQCGTVSVSEHFRQWEDLGLPLGDLYEVKWLVEAQFNSGSVEFTTATVKVE